MPHRVLPRTDMQRVMALATAKSVNDNLPIGEVVISQATADRLDIAQPNFEAKVTLRDVAYSEQSIITVDVEQKRQVAITIVSQFFQSFFMGVSRGYFPASHKAFYGLDPGTTAIPDIRSDEKLHFWGNKIKTGDPLRVAAGGAAMAMPTIVQFAASFDPYVAAKIIQRNKKEAYDQAQEVVEALRPEIDVLILNIWDEVEAHFNTGDINSKRRHAQVWGVTYANLPNEFSMTGTVTDINNLPVDGVTISIESLGVSAQTNSFGEYNFPVVAAGTYTVEVTKEGYQTQSIPNIVIEEGVVKTLNVQIISVTGTIIVNVNGEGQPLADALVEITELALSASTPPEGQVTFNFVTPGTWNVTVSKPGWTPQTQPVTIEANMTVTMMFDLMPA